MKPNTQDMYVGKSMRGFDVRMKEHYSNIVNSSNRNQIPGYNLIRRAGLGEWIQFPLCLVHASNDFEMRIEMRILERDFIIFCRPSLNMPFVRRVEKGLCNYESKHGHSIWLIFVYGICYYSFVFAAQVSRLLSADNSNPFIKL